MLLSHRRVQNIFRKLTKNVFVCFMIQNNKNMSFETFIVCIIVLITVNWFLCLLFYQERNSTKFSRLISSYVIEPDT